MGRVLILVPNDILGGAEQYLKNIATYMFSEGHEVDVFFLKKETGSGWQDVAGEVHLFFTSSKKERMGVIACFAKLFRNRRTKYEYVFTSHIHINSFVAFLRRINVIKARSHVARESTSIFMRYKGLKLAVFKSHYKLNYHKIDLLICQTDFMLKQLKEGVPSLFNKIKIKVIPNPIKTVSLQSFREEDEVTFSNYIVSAGRLIPEKGFDLLIESFGILSKSLPDLNLVILGEGVMRSELQNKINDLGLTDKVSLHGFVKNVYPYFEKAKLCVVSSRIEGFPNVLLQMMSQNTNVVSTLCAGGIKELEGVITCQNNDKFSLVNAMQCALNRDTSKNRHLFDKQLGERSLDAFVGKVKHYLYDEN